MGPLIASEEMIDYEVIIRKNASEARGNLIKKGMFLKLAPGEVAGVRFFLRSEDEGLIRVKPKFIYSIGGKQYVGKSANYSPKVYFFSDVPPTIEQLGN